jgi:SAM-dependent methyltransferase
MNSQETYTGFARYYDLYVGKFIADLPLYRFYCRPGSKVLEIGCGTGRVLRALLETGAIVTGVDISGEMLAVARQKLAGSLEARQLVLLNHDFRVHSLDETFGLIIVSFYTFNYLLAEDEQYRFLTNVRSCLAPQGALLMDLFYPQPLARPESVGQWTESTMAGNGCNIVLQQKRCMIGTVEERVQIYQEGDRRDEIVTNRRYVSKQEAATLLSRAGFVSVRVSDGYALDELHPVGEMEATGSSFVCIAAGSPG